MSLDIVMHLAHRLDGDKDLKTQLRELPLGDLKEMSKLASGLGLEFTTQELKSVLDHAAELNDEQLDKMVGGFADGSVRPILIGLLLPMVQPPSLNSFFATPK